MNQLWDLESSGSSWVEMQSFDLDLSHTFACTCQLYSWNASGDAFMTDIRTMLRRGSSGGVAPLFSAVYQLLNTQKTLGALLWDVRVRLDGSAIRYEVRNPGGSNVFWLLDGFYARGMQDDSYIP